MSIVVPESDKYSKYYDGPTEEQKKELDKLPIVVHADDDRLTTFPITRPGFWNRYKKNLATFWVAEDIDTSADYMDYSTRMSPAERSTLIMILGFFAASDGIVNENLSVRFSREIPILEVSYWYVFQMFMENIHAETYSLLIKALIKNADEIDRMLNAIKTDEFIQKKAKWSFNWIDSNDQFAERLLAFACVEGIFFQASFAFISWLGSPAKNLVPGVVKANHFIRRDEGEHTAFACDLFKSLKPECVPSDDRIREIISDAVALEKEFVRHIMPEDMQGMNAKLMYQHIEFMGNKMYNDVCGNENNKLIYPDISESPFDSFMATMTTKTNFFERRVAEYSKRTTVSESSIVNGKRVIIPDIDF